MKFPQHVIIINVSKSFFNEHSLEETTLEKLCAPLLGSD